MNGRMDYAPRNTGSVHIDTRVPAGYQADGSFGGHTADTNVQIGGGANFRADVSPSNRNRTGSLERNIEMAYQQPGGHVQPAGRIYLDQPGSATYDVNSGMRDSRVHDGLRIPGGSIDSRAGFRDQTGQLRKSTLTREQ